MIEDENECPCVKCGFVRVAEIKSEFVGRTMGGALCSTPRSWGCPECLAQQLLSSNKSNAVVRSASVGCVRRDSGGYRGVARADPKGLHAPSLEVEVQVELEDVCDASHEELIDAPRVLTDHWPAGTYIHIHIAGCARPSIVFVGRVLARNVLSSFLVMSLCL